MVIDMKYKTTDEMEHFDFHEAVISDLRTCNGLFIMILDNVKILPENSCNRDIRTMRTNQLEFRIRDARIESLTEEGYQVYDADGRLIRREEDRQVNAELFSETFGELCGCNIYAIEKKDDQYEIFIDTEDHTYLLRVKGSGDTQEWERFMSLTEEY